MSSGPNTHDDDLVTVEQASRALGRSVPTVYRWLRRGLLQRAKRPKDRRTFVTADSIAACSTGGTATIVSLASEVRQLRLEVSELRQMLMTAGGGGTPSVVPARDRKQIIDDTFQQLEEPA